jgi:CoA:oxalate CoA-transferase
VFATIGICAALTARGQTGRGQKVDIAMLDGQVALLEHALARVALEPTVPTRTGAHHATLAPFGAFEASDGNIVIAAANDTLFGTLAGALGQPELTANLCFDGPKRNRLFMAASQSLYAVYVRTQGAAPG